ncbi:hypothetical protein L596_027391 [Steinernema carpocapsae]|uniref:Uncharacterized protein n=1 Tax=Steinernema carpocapsae TaxID=34508 RepID=A0A4U5M476_STECR|nr:hypothetical protein L596_027391 [Steinernema carpocapsae]
MKFQKPLNPLHPSKHANLLHTGTGKSFYQQRRSTHSIRSLRRYNRLHTHCRNQQSKTPKKCLDRTVQDTQLPPATGSEIERLPGKQRKRNGAANERR